MIFNFSRANLQAKKVLRTLALAGSLIPAVTTSQEPDYAITSNKAQHSLLLDIIRIPQQNRIITVGDRGHILYSDDDGSIWQQATVPTQQLLTAVYFPTPLTGYAVGHDALILKTTDGGHSWQIIYQDRELEAPLLDVWFANEHDGVAVGAFGAILTTNDGGATWIDRTGDLDNEEGFHYNAITSDGEGNLWLVGEAGLLFHSHDGANQWRRLQSPYQGSLFGVTASDKKVIIHGLLGNAFVSTDQGLNWQPVNTRLTKTLFGSITRKNGKTILVGSAGAIVREARESEWAANIREGRLLLNALTETNNGDLLAVGQGGVHRLK